MSVSFIVLRGGWPSPRLWFVRILENEPVPDYAGRNRRTNAAIAAPISSGLSSWMKWAPATVISVWFGHVRQKSRIRPVVKDHGSALLKSFGIGLSLSQPASSRAIATTLAGGPALGIWRGQDRDGRRASPAARKGR